MKKLFPGSKLGGIAETPHADKLALEHRVMNCINTRWNVALVKTIEGDCLVKQCTALQVPSLIVPLMNHRLSRQNRSGKTSEISEVLQLLLSYLFLHRIGLCLH
jgi:hypothetical protein